MIRKLTSTTALIVVAALTLAACMGGSDDSAPVSAADTANRQESSATTIAAAATTIPSPDTAGAEGERVVAIGGTGALPAVLDPADLGRSIVFTATITVEVDDVVAAGKQAQAAVSGLGGLLFGQETRTGPQARSTLTIKVPPENFAAALERLAGIGELTSQTVFADDVTERVVDLQSQIITAAASVQRLRGFLDNAADLEDLASLEAELLRRETDLEVLRGRLRTLDDQVALATIVLTLVEPADPTPEPAIELVQTAYLGLDDGQGCPGSDEFTVDEDQAFTVCFTVTNSGDTALGDIEVRDRGLDTKPKNLIVVEGDLEAPLLPGGVIVLAFEAEARTTMYVEPQVSARALDAGGDRIRYSVETTVEHLVLDIVEDTSLPGFMDAMRSAGRTLQQMLGVIVVIAGAAVPFLWVPVLVIATAWSLDRRRQRSAIAATGPAAGADDADDGDVPIA